VPAWVRLQPPAASNGANGFPVRRSPVCPMLSAARATPAQCGPKEAIGADLLDLVRRCRDGDPNAWRAFLPLFQEIGSRALRSFRFSSTDSDDVLSEVLTSLYAGGLSRFRGQTLAEFFGFLKAVVRNRAIDFVKERGRWVPTDSPGEGSTEDSSANSLTGLADEECLEFLRQEVNGLKREDRELYLMKARGFKEREIAAQTGKPPGTVASQIARLLERLRASLRERGCL